MYDVCVTIVDNVWRVCDECVDNVRRYDECVESVRLKEWLIVTSLIYRNKVRKCRWSLISWPHTKQYFTWCSDFFRYTIISSEYKYNICVYWVYVRWGGTYHIQDLGEGKVHFDGDGMGGVGHGSGGLVIASQ